MNYLSKNKDIINAFSEIFNQHPASSEQLILSPVYGRNRKLSFIIITSSRMTTYHALIITYNRAVKVYDVFRYVNRNLWRVRQFSQLQPIYQKIINYTAKHIPRQDIYSPRIIREDHEKQGPTDNETLVQSLEDDIVKLKDKLKLSHNQIDGYRYKIKMLNHLIQVLKKRLNSE